jgi:hypothetical protein
VACYRDSFTFYIYWSPLIPVQVIGVQIQTHHRSEQQQAVSLPSASAGVLLNLLFDPEDGGDMILPDVGLFSNYRALQPRRQQSS